MDKYHRHWFTDEVNLHVGAAIASYLHLEELVSDPATRQMRDVWFVLTSFLTHAAMASKLLDPVSGNAKTQERGRALREYLEVGQDSAILKRAGRDNIEHIDERIDRWVERGDTKIMEMVFKDREGYEYICSGDGAVRRVLILDEMVFVSEARCGIRVETALRPIYEELVALLNRCQHKLETESPYNYLLAQALINWEG